MVVHCPAYFSHQDLTYLINSAMRRARLCCILLHLDKCKAKCYFNDFCPQWQHMCEMLPVFVPKLLAPLELLIWKFGRKIVFSVSLTLDAARNDACHHYTKIRHCYILLFCCAPRRSVPGVRQGISPAVGEI